MRKQLNRKDKCIIYSAQERDCRLCLLKPRCTTRRVHLVSRHLNEDALQRMDRRTTPDLMRLRRCTVEYPFGLLKYQILEKPRLLMRGRWGAGTEMALATLAYNLKRVMAVLGSGDMRARLVAA